MFQIYLSGTFRLDWILLAHKQSLFPKRTDWVLSMVLNVKRQRSKVSWRQVTILSFSIQWRYFLKKQWRNHLKCVPYSLEYTLCCDMLYTELSQWCSVWHLPSASLSHTDFRLCDLGHPWMWDRQDAGSSFIPGSCPLIDAVWIPETSLETSPSYPSCELNHMKGDRHPKWQLAGS